MVVLAGTLPSVPLFVLLLLLPPSAFLTDARLAMSLMRRMKHRSTLVASRADTSMTVEYAKKKNKWIEEEKGQRRKQTERRLRPEDACSGTRLCERAQEDRAMRVATRTIHRARTCPRRHKLVDDVHTWNFESVSALLTFCGADLPLSLQIGLVGTQNDDNVG